MAEDGVWRTVSGRRVFIKEGQSLTDAMRDSGKFKDSQPKETVEDLEKKLDGLFEEHDELVKEIHQLEGIQHAYDPEEETPDDYYMTQEEMDRIPADLKVLREKLDNKTIETRNVQYQLRWAKNTGFKNDEQDIARMMGVNPKTMTFEQYTEVLKAHDAVKEFTGYYYKNVRYQDDYVIMGDYRRESLGRFIDRAPKYEGETHRGIKFQSSQEYNDFKASLYESQKDGSTMDMRGISSWTRDIQVAEYFADSPRGVVITNKTTNSSGIGIERVAYYKKEKEVVFSEKTRWRVTSIDEKTDSRTIYVSVVEER